jgi:hypothetical protein
LGHVADLDLDRIPDPQGGVRLLVTTEEVVELLERERARLDALAHALLERETLDQQDAYRVAGVEPPAFDAEREAKATA